MSNWNCTALILLVFMLSFAPLVGAAESESPRTRCGEALEAEDVSLVDLESYGDDLEAAFEFASQELGEFGFVSEQPELMFTESSPMLGSRKQYLDMLREEAADRGCNVLLVLEAGVYREMKPSKATTRKSSDMRLVVIGHAKVLLGMR